MYYSYGIFIALLIPLCILIGWYRSKIQYYYKYITTKYINNNSKLNYIFDIIDKYAELAIKVIQPFVILLIITLIATVTHCYFTNIIYTLYDIYSSNTVTLLTFIGLYILHCVLFNYYYCIRISPGYVPPDILDNNNIIQLLQQDPEFNTHNVSNIHILSKPYRYCYECKQVKPYRTHHCSVCNKCIMRMDHHCVFIAQCVGHYNIKYFIMFLLYIDIGCIFILSCCTTYIYNIYKPIHIHPHSIEYYQSTELIIVIAVCLAGICCSTGFLSWTLYLCCNNITTVEYYKQNYAYKQDSIWINLCDALGYCNNKQYTLKQWTILLYIQTILRWLLPYRFERYVSNGIIYNINDKHNKNVHTNTDV